MSRALDHTLQTLPGTVKLLGLDGAPADLEKSDPDRFQEEWDQLSLQFQDRSESFFQTHIQSWIVEWLQSRVADRSMLEQWLQRLDWAVVVTGGDDDLLWASPAASRLFSLKGGERSFCAAMLPESCRAQVVMQMQFVRDYLESPVYYRSDLLMRLNSGVVEDVVSIQQREDQPEAVSASACCWIERNFSRWEVGGEQLLVQLFEKGGASAVSFLQQWMELFLQIRKSLPDEAWMELPAIFSGKPLEWSVPGQEQAAPVKATLAPLLNEEDGTLQQFLLYLEDRSLELQLQQELDLIAAHRDHAVAEMEDFLEAFVHREQTMLELKKRINLLLQQQGEPPQWDMSELEAENQQDLERF